MGILFKQEVINWCSSLSFRGCRLFGCDCSNFEEICVISVPMAVHSPAVCLPKGFLGLAALVWVSSRLAKNWSGDISITDMAAMAVIEVVE